MDTVEGPDFAAAVALLQSRLPGLAAVYVFGSAARDALRADSDIDLAVLASARIDADLRFDLEQQCARLFGREVDLVDVRSAPLPLQAAIVGEGRLLLAAEPVQEAFFTNTVLSRYCAFNEERRPLLAAIRQRGSVYA
jgi:predicted nucleotidyltransferase